MTNKVSIEIETVMFVEDMDWVNVWVPDSWSWKGVSSPLAGKKIHMKIDSTGEIQDCIVPNGSIIGIEREELYSVGEKFSPKFSFNKGGE